MVQNMLIIPGCLTPPRSWLRPISYLSSHIIAPGHCDLLTGIQMMLDLSSKAVCVIKNIYYKTKIVLLTDKIICNTVIRFIIPKRHTNAYIYIYIYIYILCSKTCTTLYYCFINTSGIVSTFLDVMLFRLLLFHISKN